MYPFIHIGPLTLGSYGLLVAAGLICAFFVLRADLARRNIEYAAGSTRARHPADAETIIGVTGLAGIAGARLYHLLETPAEFFANPVPLLFSTMGFAWFGAVIGGVIALFFLARSYRMSMLLMLDVASPAAALGYGVGRIGCLVSGDGDYGIPTSLPWGMSFPNGLVPTSGACLERGWPANCRVHPTPIYEFLAALVIAHFLWRVWKPAAPGGKRSAQTEQPAGRVFAWYLIGTGIVRFLVEFIRLNPPSLFGLTNAQNASVVSVIAGILLLFLLRAKNPEARAGKA
jgi:phosphatidylglycerol:prolipoprotein diacylglycerol transferase